MQGRTPISWGREGRGGRVTRCQSPENETAVEGERRGREGGEGRERRSGAGNNGREVDIGRRGGSSEGTASKLLPTQLAGCGIEV